MCIVVADVCEGIRDCVPLWPGEWIHRGQYPVRDRNIPISSAADLACALRGAK